MLEVSGLHFNSQVAAVDVGISNVLVVYADNVAAELCDDLGYAEELTRLVEQLDVEQGGSAGLNKAAVNDSGQDSNVDVAAGYEAHDLLALYGYLIEHYSRNGNCASALCDELLLLDEHTAALDPGTAEKVLELTKNIVAEEKITCLMITHNMNQALELGNRTLMMANGNIVLDVGGAERASMTVEDLIARFKTGAGHALDNDRILLSE